MKVFISWSGELSKSIAEEFRKWLPGVLQAVKPYFTPDDITKGARWSSEISKELEESKIGIIILTPDNLKSSWVMFEAGALSKQIDKSKVVPILFNVEPSDIKGPLVQFQASRNTKSDIKKVVKMINNELKDHGITSEVLNDVFEMWYPKLENQINDKLSSHSSEDQNLVKRSQEDILKEILELTRKKSIFKKGFDIVIDHKNMINILDPLIDLQETILFQGNHDLIDKTNSLSMAISNFISDNIDNPNIDTIYRLKLKLKHERLFNLIIRSREQSE